MTSHPGDDSQRPDQPDASGTEHTQPIGYWERQALEEQQRAQQSQQPDQPSYPAGQPQDAQPAWGQPHGGEPYGGQSYGGQSYGGQPYGGQPYGGQPAYGQPYGAPSPYGGWGPRPVPDHPRATLSLVLGLIAVVGTFTCLVPIVLSPVAWVVGTRTLRDIRRSQGQVGGEGMARAGQVLGIVGTVLLVLGLVAVALLVITLLNAGNTSPDYTNA